MILIALLSLQVAAQDTALRRVERDGITYDVAAADRADLPALAAMVGSGRTAAESFFGAPFARPFAVRIYPTRAALTAHWAQAWGVPDLATECWMVGSGLAEEFSLLAPRAWRAEACEHDAADTAATRRLIWHELVHVYHAQRSPSHNFDGMDDLAWLAEGVAAYASGQLATQYLGQPRAAIAAGQAPAGLARAWSGRYRYAVSGSLVAYVDATYGRAVLRDLLGMTTPAQVLAALGTTEPELLARWRAWVLASG